MIEVCLLRGAKVQRSTLKHIYTITLTQLNPFMPKDFLNLFESTILVKIIEMKHELTKYLKESCWLVYDQYSCFYYFPTYYFFRKKYLGLPWLLPA